MDILILGGTGQVGLELQSLTWPSEARVHAPPRAALDLTAPGALAAAVHARAWGAIINAAAYTAVDKAEAEPARAWALNAEAPAHLAHAAARANIPLIHVSTDYVFAGDKAGFYDEDDAIAPASVYGASKAAGEIAVRAGHPHSVIVRTAWVVSARRANFIKTMLALAQTQARLRVVDDQRGSPTSGADLAQALQTIALAVARDPDAPCGVFHCVNAGEASWWELASAALDRASTHGHPRPPIEAIATSAYPTAAKRPMNSRLSARKVADAFGVHMRPWRAAVDDIVDALMLKEGAHA